MGGGGLAARSVVLSEGQAGLGAGPQLFPPAPWPLPAYRCATPRTTALCPDRLHHDRITDEVTCSCHTSTVHERWHRTWESHCTVEI